MKKPCRTASAGHVKAAPEQMPQLLFINTGAGEGVSFRIRRAYCTPRTNDEKPFREFFEKAIVTDSSSLPVFFFGVGDHGGGIYEKQLRHLLKYQDEFDIEFCTLERYFKQLEKLDLPVVIGELTHHSPGCYSALGEIKEWMADCEKNLYKAEKLNLQIRGKDQKKESAKLYGAWDKLLFNYFHDIYSGTCIGDACRHEIRDLCGAVNDAATESMERSLCRIGFIQILFAIRHPGFHDRRRCSALESESVCRAVRFIFRYIP